MNNDYKNPIFRELRDQQVRYAPRDQKLVQADRAEILYHEIQEGNNYSYKYLCLRITGFKTEIYEDVLMSPDNVRHDLHLLIEDLTDAANLTVREVDEKVSTTSELCQQFNVASKTISRWRRSGLISRKFIVDHVKRIGFLESSVNWFQTQNAKQIDRSRRFTQLTQKEKITLIQQGRILASAGLSPTETAKKLALMTGRSVETIRYTIKSFDQDNADISLFPNRTMPLREEAKKRIFQSFRSGEQITQLAQKYQRTVGSIYRIIGQSQAKRIIELPIEFIDSLEFGLIKNTKEEKEFCTLIAMNSQKEVTSKGQKTALPHGLPSYLAVLYEFPLLTPEQEKHLFRKMNYLKYKASKLRDSLNMDRPNTSLMRRIELLYDEAAATKNEIVLANLRLVVSIAKRHVSSMANLFELISDGNVSLIKAAEKFDYSRGNRFSTYASWAIMRNYARTIPDEKKYRDRFHLSGGMEVLEETTDDRTNVYFEEKTQAERENQVGYFLEQLDEREHNIIVRRYGLGREHSPQTLHQVGADLGVTKERIRQIETRALAKLRQAAEDERLEIPGLSY